MAAAPAPAPACRLYRVQLRFVTEEQLFAPGPLSSPHPRSLLLEVRPAGEEADATVTDGEVLGTTHPRESRAQVAARGCAWAACGGVKGRAREGGGERGADGAARPAPRRVCCEDPVRRGPGGPVGSLLRSELGRRGRRGPENQAWT